MAFVQDHERQEDRISRRALLRSAGVFALFGSGMSLLAACGDKGSKQPAASGPGAGISVALYRQEGCECCSTYADYLRENGFEVDMKTVDDLAPIRERYRVPDDGVGCHTSLVDDYVVEGHVPVEAIDRLLTDRPDFDGISVVGMPVNSPGMGDPNGEPLEVLSFNSGRVAEYMSITTF